MITKNAANRSGNRLWILVLENVAPDGTANSPDLAHGLHAHEQFLVRDERAPGQYDRACACAYDFTKRLLCEQTIMSS